MKKIFTLIAALTLSVGLWGSTTIYHWQGSHVIHKDNPFKIDASEFDSAKAGYLIDVQFTTNEDTYDAIEFKANGQKLPGTRYSIVQDWHKSFQYYMTQDAVDSCKVYGMEICGNNFTLTYVNLVDNGIKMKEGRTIWTGYFWVDSDLRTLEVFKEALTAVKDWSKYSAMRFYSEKYPTTDFSIYLLADESDAGKIATSDPTDETPETKPLKRYEGYAELDLTKVNPLTVINNVASDRLMIRMKKQGSAEFQLTDVVLVPVPKYTEYENWQIKQEGSEWQNMIKVGEGLFMLADINWETRSGFNVKSDDNPIKKDWYAADDPDVVIGEEAIPPVIVDVYLRVIDDETLKIGIGVEPPIQFVDTASGLKFEVTSMEEPRTVKVINNEYPGTSYTVPGTVTYWEKTFDVTEIGVEAFHDCSSLESITLPESVTTLAYSSLSTSGLKSITIPATVTTIGEYAFAGCLDLQSVTFQGNACHDTIGDNAFEDVGKTTPATLTLPDDWAGSTPENSETPWYGGYFDYTAPGPRVGGKFVDEASGLKFEITSCDGTSKTVKAIAGSYTGASYDIPETVTNWEETFDVTEIDAYAFAECHLETFTVPASIVKIGAGAFSNCTSLQSVTFKGNACQNDINVTAFYGVGENTPATLTLPDNWTGAKPESSILEWFGGFCAIRE